MKISLVINFIFCREKEKENEFEFIDLEVNKDEKEYSNDINLLGHRVELKWTSGKWYRGTICKFDKLNQKHFIVYDDGDERWYNLNEMVFTFVNEEEEWVSIEKDDEESLLFEV